MSDIAKHSGNADPTVPITRVQVFWAVCALVGLAGVGWAASQVRDEAFLDEVRRSWSAMTVSLDLLLLGIPVVAFAVLESRRLGMRVPWIWIPLAVPLPGAFLIPLFFLLRERALLEQAARAGARSYAAAPAVRDP